MKTQIEQKKNKRKTWNEMRGIERERERERERDRSSCLPNSIVRSNCKLLAQHSTIFTAV
jgi:hypothetical protein